MTYGALGANCALSHTLSAESLSRFAGFLRIDSLTGVFAGQKGWESCVLK